MAREEFDFTIAEIAEGRPLDEVRGVTFRGPDGQVVHTPDRPILEDMDRLPYVTDVYRRDLNVDDYFIGYLRHPYVSLYTGRGCRSRCTFCLWPQTVGGHRYRTRSAQHVLGEMARITELFPSVREVFFDDDTFTDDRQRAVEIARGMGRLGLTWSCNAKANVPYETLTALRENGLRLLLVGYESGNQQILVNIKKGVRVERARQFTKDCRDLGITIHGTFIVGLPGETTETIQETIRFAKEINPHSLQVSIAAPYPGTALYDQAKENGWLPDDDAALIDEHGVQAAALSYPNLNRTEIYDSVESFYRQFYFRAGKIAEMSAEMLRSPDMMRRRLREGAEFLSFLRRRDSSVRDGRERSASAQCLPPSAYRPAAQCLPPRQCTAQCLPPGSVARLRHDAPLGGLIAEHAPQLGAGPVQPGHHGADRAMHEVRDLTVGEALHVGQVDGSPEVARQFPQGPDDAGVGHPVERGVLGGPGLGTWFRPALRELPVLDARRGDPGGLALTAPVAVDERVGENPQQPGPGVGALAELVEVRVRLGVGLLQQVLGVMRVAGHGRGRRPQLSQMRQRLVGEA